MPINLVIAVTDGDWFDMLRRQANLSEVNFWAPSAANFRALQPGELFLFKLHAPRNVIVGGGIFAYANALPCSLAWQAFGEANGARSSQEMRARIARYRRADPADRSDFEIGCRILTQPFFFAEADWMPVPASWAPNIVSFKTYNTGDADGLALWNAVHDRLNRSGFPGVAEVPTWFGEPQLITPRLGQGAFRVLVTDTYNRRCAITQERTLPALEAAHIRPYGDGGEHEARNGLLLRRDIHSLFDAGYVTVTPELRFEVSRRIREEFDNGRHYYELHGKPIFAPADVLRRPDPSALRWHSEYRNYLPIRIDASSSFAVRAPSEELPEDADWETRVRIVLRPKRSLSPEQADVVRREYGFEGEYLTVEVRKALEFYFDRRWGLDQAGARLERVRTEPIP